MGRNKAAYYVSLLAGAVVVVLSLTAFANLRGRPAIPWEVLAEQSGIDKDVLPEKVVRVDGFPVADRKFDFKFVAAHHRIGDTIEFVVSTGRGDRTVRDRLVPYYAEGTFPVVYLLTGAFGFLIGFAVFILRPEDRRARFFFWLCVAFSSAVMISGEWYCVQGRPAFLVLGVLFFFAYTVTPALLLRFAQTFGPQGRRPGFPALWAVSGLFGAFFSCTFVLALLLPSVEVFRLKRYFTVFRLYFFALCVAAALYLLRTYRASVSREQRDQVKWVIFGLAVGLGPFMFVYQLPLGLGLTPLLSEEVASSFFVLLPLALAFTILRYRLMDINVIINRSLVYSLLTMVTVGIYLLSIEGLKQLFSSGARQGRGWVPVGAAVVAAVVFAPARNRIQLLVDKAFFRRGYDFRRAVRGFTAASAKAFSAEDLFGLFEAALAEALPVEKAAALILESGDGPGRIFLRSGLDDGAVASILAPPPGMGPSGADGRPDLWGFEVAVPVSLGEGGPSGWVFAGPKRSGARFTDDDRELLETLGVELGSALRRLRLQEEVVYERASRERSEELSRLKTEFISSVSHELRTPMSSLQGISELLHSGKVAEGARRDRLLELMAAECGRLGRFLHNVLDFGRIEQNTKSYEFRETDLGPIVAEVADIVRSAMPGEDLDLAVAAPKSPVVAEVDPDAVRQALLNLVDNAIKYSAGRKHVEVRLGGGAEEATISVADRGIGIPAEDREKVFEAFFRCDSAVRHDPKGVGLGLKIVKHIMDAHGGSVELRSEPGRGTTVALKFSKRRKS